MKLIFSPTSPAAAAEDIAADSPAACNPAPNWPEDIGNVPAYIIRIDPHNDKENC